MVELPKAKHHKSSHVTPFRGKRGGSWPGRGSMNRRKDESRKRDNLVFEAERKERAKLLTFACLKETPEIGQSISIGETQQSLLQQVQVSTRGVFLNTLACYQQLRLLIGQQVENICPPMTACRAALLEVSLNLYSAGESRDLETLAPQVDVRMNLPLGVRDMVKGFTRGIAPTCSR
jgi:hypothetical protein